MTGIYDQTKFRQWALFNLRKNEGWIRLTSAEMRLMGGAQFFAGCEVIQESKGWTAGPATGAKSGREEGTYRFRYKVIAPSGGWVPGGTTHYGTSQYTTDEGETSMQEHHISKDTLLERVRQNKEAYGLVLGRFQELYRAELEKKTEEHVQGKIPQNQIAVMDKNGAIQSVQDMSSEYDLMLEELELDARGVIILNHDDYCRLVLSSHLNLDFIAAQTKRLEEL